MTLLAVVALAGVADKKTVAMAGGYGMKKASKIGLEWDQQAANVQAAILKVQDPAKIAVRADGTTDAITGASIHVAAVFLAIDALKDVH